jgi:outer membrane protein OmpA-like peptidoglycan-associated protein
MKPDLKIPKFFPRQLAVFVLASAVGVPAFAQQAQSAGVPQSTPPSVAQSQPSPQASTSNTAPKEGFWGRVNPFARKKWVNKRIDPLKDRLSELDEVNAKNAHDIQDVDGRAQAGIHQAQSAADAANQTASAAGDQAKRAGDTAQGAAGHVDQLNSTVSGLDQYKPISDVDVAFRGGLPTLSPAARKQLDDLATSLAGHKGYILEVEAHSPAAGSVGIQNSQRLAEAVKRYLVTEHEIPVYRMHSVALGNVQVAEAGQDDTKPARVRTSSVHIRLMENSLAAQGTVPPPGAISSTGADRP